MILQVKETVSEVFKSSPTGQKVQDITKFLFAEHREKFNDFTKKFTELTSFHQELLDRLKLMTEEVAAQPSCWPSPKNNQLKILHNILLLHILEALHHPMLNVAWQDGKDWPAEKPVLTTWLKVDSPLVRLVNIAVHKPDSWTSTKHDKVIEWSEYLRNTTKKIANKVSLSTLSIPSLLKRPGALVLRPVRLPEAENTVPWVVDMLGRCPLHMLKTFRRGSIEWFQDYPYFRIAASQDLFGHEPFHVAILSDNEEAARYFFPNHPTIIKTTSTYLYYLASRGYASLFKKLLAPSLRSWFILVARDQQGYTSLYYAAYHGHLETVQTILEYGAPLEKLIWLDPPNRCPVRVAIERGHTKVAQEILLSAPPICPKARLSRDQQELLLDKTLATGSLELLHALLDRAILILDADTLHIAVRKAIRQRLDPVLITVLASDDRVNLLSICPKGRTLLHEIFAEKEEKCSSSNCGAGFHCSTPGSFQDVVKMLLAGDTTSAETEMPNINSQDHDGRTALHLAARNATETHVCFAVMSLLNDSRIDVNVCDKELAATPLIAAIAAGNTPFAFQLIIRPDVNLNAKDSNGDTALDSAQMRGMFEIERALRMYGAQSKYELQK